MIDKRFQIPFILRYSFVVAFSAMMVVGSLYLLKNQAYSLLPDGASVLAQMDVDKYKSLKQGTDGKWQVAPEGEGEEYFPLKQRNNGYKFYSAFDLYMWPVIVVTLLNIFIIMLFSIFFSHKVAGPLFKIKKILNHYLATGEFHNIELRKGDQLIDLAKLINHVMHRPEHKHSNDQHSKDNHG